MNIGIKYCGGCNPRYDRAGYVKALIERHPHATFEPARSDVRYDLLLVVCGCSSMCARTEELLFNKVCYICTPDKDACIEGLQ